MRSRIVISAFIFIALCGLKLLFPDEALRLRDTIVPMVNRESSLREDCMAIGHAISGEESYLTCALLAGVGIFSFSWGLRSIPLLAELWLFILRQNKSCKRPRPSIQ